MDFIIASLHSGFSKTEAGKGRGYQATLLSLKSFSKAEKHERSVSFGGMDVGGKHLYFSKNIRPDSDYFIKPHDRLVTMIFR